MAVYPSWLGLRQRIIEHQRPSHDRYTAKHYVPRNIIDVKLAGKSGGARVIYLYLERHDAVVFFYVYTKAKSENLTADQLKRLRNAAAIIKQEFII